VVVSSTTCGINAPVTRVHYYQDDVDLDRVQELGDLPSRI
jgi:hypothetical protein